MTSPRSSFLIVGLTLLVLLGHVCELPVGPLVAAHAHDAADHSHHHDSDADQVSCDPVAGVRPSACAYAHDDLDVDVSPALVVGGAPLRGVATALLESNAVLRHRPLFLLYASFLI